MSNQLSVLETVAAVRAVLTVAKQLQDAKPQFSAQDIALAVGAGVRAKLDKLTMKGYSTLTAAQITSYKALTDAQIVLPQVAAILEMARSQTPEEIADVLEAKRIKAVAAKVKRDAVAATKAKAAPAAKPATADMFAKA